MYNWRHSDHLNDQSTPTLSAASVQGASEAGPESRVGEEKALRSKKTKDNLARRLKRTARRPKKVDLVVNSPTAKKTARRPKKVNLCLEAKESDLVVNSPEAAARRPKKVTLWSIARRQQPGGRRK